MRLDIQGERYPQEKSLKSKRALKKWKSLPSDTNVNKSKSKKWSNDFHSEVLHINDEPLLNFTKEGEAIGIITLEDVIEELLQVGGTFVTQSNFYHHTLKKLQPSPFCSFRKKSTTRRIFTKGVNDVEAPVSTEI